MSVSNKDYTRIMDTLENERAKVESLTQKLAARESDLRNADALAATADRVIESLASENERLRERLKESQEAMRNVWDNAEEVDSWYVDTQYLVEMALVDALGELVPTEPTK